MKNRMAPAMMVADDFENKRLMMKLLFEMNGYRVVAAAVEMAAIEAVGFTQSDLILMDLCSPGLNGIPALRGIRERAELNNVPITIVSGYDDAHLHMLAMNAGCAEYVVKPVDLDYVENLLERYCPMEV